MLIDGVIGAAVGVGLTVFVVGCVYFFNWVGALLVVAAIIGAAFNIMAGAQQ